MNFHNFANFVIAQIFIVFVFTVIAAEQTTFAATYVVTRVDDRNAVCASGTDCSLREAVGAANATGVDDTITFSIPAASCDPTTFVCTITLVGSEIIIDIAGAALSINGTGANLLTIDGGTGTNRIFYNNGAVATITGSTLTGGNGSGAAPNGIGGAIYTNFGTLVLQGVHVTGNSSTGNAGGVNFRFGTNHQITSSTISANTSTAGSCGGFYSEGAGLTVTNSTISGNSAGINSGGGFCSNSSTTLRSVTITSNSAGDGGGIYYFGGALNLGNTIVAGNTGGPRPDVRFDGGTLTTAGYNLIGKNDGAVTAFPAGNPNVNNDIVGTSTTVIDPQLGALTITNGGTTPTHALMTGSPAIDKGSSFTLTTDQRGLTRPFDNPAIPNAAGGDGADIGAFEVQVAPSAASVSLSGRVTTESGSGIRNVYITLTDPNGNTRTAVSCSFGYYFFGDVSAGETYIISASAKRYQFAPQVITVTDELNDVDFMATQ